MAKIKLTPWFPKTAKPVRKGVYIASAGKNRFFRYWTGEYWTEGTYFPDLEGFPNSHSRKFLVQDLYWKGLAR